MIEPMERVPDPDCHICRKSCHDCMCPEEAIAAPPVEGALDLEAARMYLEILAHFLGRIREAAAGHPYAVELLDGADAALRTLAGAHPSGEATKHCAECGRVMQHAPGIGYWCSEHGDGPAREDASRPSGEG